MKSFIFAILLIAAVSTQAIGLAGYKNQSIMMGSRKGAEVTITRSNRSAINSLDLNGFLSRPRSLVYHGKQLVNGTNDIFVFKIDTGFHCFKLYTPIGGQSLLKQFSFGETQEKALANCQ